MDSVKSLYIHHMITYPYFDEAIVLKFEISIIDFYIDVKVTNQLPSSYCSYLVSCQFVSQSLVKYFQVQLRCLSLGFRNTKTI